VSPGRPLQRSREETRWAALNAALQLSCKVPPTDELVRCSWCPMALTTQAALAKMAGRRVRRSAAAR
jgi:hypothetical protein